MSDASGTTRFAVGVDLGGTNTKVALVDERARLVAHDSHPTRAERGPEAVIDDIVSMIEALLPDSRSDQAGYESSTCEGAGVGAPGPLSVRDGRIIRMANLAGWENVPLRDDIAQRLGMPVTLDNDGNVAAMGEYWSRSLLAPPASQDVEDDLVMLTLGTGVGAGIILGGCILHGHFENAGEIGHMIVVPNGEPCPCGQRGCLERYAAAESVVRRVLAAIEVGESCILKRDIDTGALITASRVAECAKDGDTLCAQIWKEACTYLAQACVNIQHVINPARIVLGGGLTAAGPLLIDGVTQSFHAMTWKLHDDMPRIELSCLGSNAGVIGAAALRLCGSAY